MMTTSLSQTLRCLLRVSVVVIAAVALASCVTTQTGGIGDKADPQKALQYSLQLARGYIRDGNWEAAKRHLKTALEIDDRSAEIYEAMALVFQNTGELELAEKNYEKSIHLDGSATRVRNNYAAFLYARERYKEASKQLEIVVKDMLYPNRGPALVNLGRCYRQLDEWAKAEESFRRAFLLDRNNIGLMLELAQSYYMLGEYPKAQQYYDGFRSQTKRQPPQALLLGIRLAYKFDNKNAMSSYALVLKNLYPTSKEYLDYKQEFGNGG